MRCIRPAAEDDAVVGHPRVDRHHGEAGVREPERDPPRHAGQVVAHRPVDHQHGEPPAPRVLARRRRVDHPVPALAVLRLGHHQVDGQVAVVAPELGAPARAVRDVGHRPLLDPLAQPGHHRVERRDVVALEGVAGAVDPHHGHVGVAGRRGRCRPGRRPPRSTPPRPRCPAPAGSAPTPGRSGGRPSPPSPPGRASATTCGTCRPRCRPAGRWGRGSARRPTGGRPRGRPGRRRSPAAPASVSSS